MAAAAADDDSIMPPISILRRRNSTGKPTTLTVPSSYTSSSTGAGAGATTSSASSSSSSVDFELVSIKPTSYTSLRDILPSPATAVHSPKAPSSSANHSGYEIPIRNRLVKQAAWAYLQPMSTTPESGEPTVFRSVWTRFSDAVLRFITGAFDCLLRSIQIGTKKR